MKNFFNIISIYTIFSYPLTLTRQEREQKIE